MLYVAASVCAAALLCRGWISFCVCAGGALFFTLFSRFAKGRAWYYLPAAVSGVLMIYCLQREVGFFAAALVFPLGVYASVGDRGRYAPPLLFLAALPVALMAVIFGSFSGFSREFDIFVALFAFFATASALRRANTKQCLLGSLLGLSLAAVMIAFPQPDAYISALILLSPALISSWVSSYIK